MGTNHDMFRGDLSIRLERRLQTYVDDKKVAGAVAVVAGLEDAFVAAVGTQDMDSATPMGMDTIFRIYSLTKPVTSVAALMLVERGSLHLDDPVADYIPAFADVEVFAGGSTEPPLLPPTVRDLLMHTSGIGGVHVLPDGPLADVYRAARLDDRQQTLEQLADKLARIPLLFQPGQGWRYGLSTDVLARVVEVAADESFGQFLKNNLFEPLSMPDTDFFVPPEKADRLAQVYGPAGNGEMRPLQGLGAATFTKQPKLEAGGSGLVSTPRDYLNFSRMLLGKGTWQGQRLLHPETVQALATNHLPPSLLPYRLPWSHAGHFTEGAGFGLGVRVLLDEEAAGVPGSEGEYGWAGAANTFLWVDPKENVVLLLFTQAFPFLHTDIDRAFKRAVYAS